MKLISNNKLLSCRLRALIVGFLLTVCSIEGYGQNIDDIAIKSSQTSVDTSRVGTDSVVVAVSLKAVKFSLDNIFDTLSVTDTVLSDEFPYFNDLDRFDFPVIDNGYIGSSAMPVDGYKYQTGFKTGIDQYNIYDIQNKFFYISNVPVTTLYFSPGSQPKEFTTRAKFAKNFKDVTLDINYARISNIGKYTNQSNKHTNLDFGLWKGRIGGKYNTFFNFIVSVHDEDNNGGIEDLDKLYRPEYSRSNVPVYLDNAKTRFDNYTYCLTEYYRIYDSDKTFMGFVPYINGNVQLSKGFYKFFDSDINGDSIVYKSYFIDRTGLRNYLKYTQISPDFNFFGYRANGEFVKLGINYNRISFDHEPLGDKGVNQFYLYANGKLNAANNLQLKWNSKVHLGDYRGDYKVEIDAGYRYKFIELHSNLKNGLYSPSFYDNNLWLSQKRVYTNDFGRIGETVLSGGLAIDKLGFFADIEKHYINNYIYLDDNLLFRQLSQGIDYFKINLKQKIKVWLIHFDNNVFLFKSSSEFKPLPRYTLRSKLYIKPFLFKHHLLLNTGFEFNFWDKYYNYGYNPVLGKFYVQNKTILDNYRRLDYYISAKVDNFLFYARFNNILFNIDRSVYFKVLNYPQNDMFFRIGVQWTLVQ